MSVLPCDRDLAANCFPCPLTAQFKPSLETVEQCGQFSSVQILKKYVYSDCSDVIYYTPMF